MAAPKIWRCPTCGNERTDGDFTCTGKPGARHPAVEGVRVKRTRAKGASRGR